MTKTPNLPDESADLGQRGNADHERRHQIIAAAEQHFRLYGFRKTSVADLGKAIGVSSTYTYRFFESKKAIGEAVVASVLGRLDHELRQVVEAPGTATQRLRRFVELTLSKSLDIFFDGTHMHELVAAAVEENWVATYHHAAVLHDMIRELISAGRSSGEFERKTPLDDVSDGVAEALRLFYHPMSLQFRSRAELDRAMSTVVSLILRSMVR
ncbi:TetR/AcrR family transcriptional regulator [Robbsia sp. KACC 23696]|uniref:TetR/AcrR family transcriptional regulator n=1 Tax=Robbsia sp. KACC 23696 TaxID=3149231 RepID=UPI00325A9A67